MELVLIKKREMVKKVCEVAAEAYDLPVDAITVLVQAYPKKVLEWPVNC